MFKKSYYHIRNTNKNDLWFNLDGINGIINKVERC
jgi:hypothetical protein